MHLDPDVDVVAVRLNVPMTLDFGPVNTAPRSAIGCSLEGVFAGRLPQFGKWMERCKNEAGRQAYKLMYCITSALLRIPKMSQNHGESLCCEAVIFFSVLLVTVLMSDGRSHWLKGYLLMLAYIFIGVSWPDINFNSSSRAVGSIKLKELEGATQLANHEWCCASRLL